ncbi:DUF1549 domain-containing protein [Anatilimnocola floriformis]|uniref:DUF1549 domain-containing protein n=1 Tax=Anatilimnocola floriformis TaxID=2948575 RepID=UPI0020C25787|nr:DUF1549 domain-containing protein [Anatilimnocola floriformis]
MPTTTDIARLIALLFVLLSTTAFADEPFQKSAAEIDRRLAEHWQHKNITPAEAASDETLLKRVSLDLIGRVPTQAEYEARLPSGKPLAERYSAIVAELLDSSEFALHQGAMLDEMLQGTAAGNAEFTDYLRRSLREGKPWDQLFRELLVGPWDTPERKPAARFLDVRAKDLDKLTTDATRVFFGVDVSCARCHDHPLVDDWKQDHYYGMASFFHRTTGGKGSIGEKTEGDVTFKGAGGTQQAARVMFLSGQIAVDPPDVDGKKPKVSRREQLVTIALGEQKFLSRALVNRLWQQYFGRGLVHPVDQIHSGNPPSVPGLLEWLAEDFVANGYDFKRLTGAIVSSRAYQLSSRWEHASTIPDEGDFAVARLQHLTPRQYAFSLLVATGRADYSPANALEQRAERLAGDSANKRITQYLAVEQQAAELLSQLDPKEDGQTSAAEALFLSNNPAVQKLFAVEANTLAAKLAGVADSKELATAAIRAVYGRAADSAEVEHLAEWINSQKTSRQRTCEQLVWVLCTAAEFRFKH